MNPLSAAQPYRQIESLLAWLLGTVTGVAVAISWLAVNA